MAAPAPAPAPPTPPTTTPRETPGGSFTTDTEGVTAATALSETGVGWLASVAADAPAFSVTPIAGAEAVLVSGAPYKGSAGVEAAGAGTVDGTGACGCAGFAVGYALVTGA